MALVSMFLKSLVLSLLVASASTSASATDASNLPSEQATDSRIKATARSVNDLSLRIMQRLVSEKTPRTIVISPIGLANCLNAVALGAGGDTRSELRKVFLNSELNEQDFGTLQKFVLTPTNGVDVSSASAMVTARDVKLKPLFLKSFESSYGGTAISASSAENINQRLNDWIRVKAHGMFDGAYPPMKPHEIRLLNALYFNGKWIDQFEGKATKIEKFFETESSPISVEMMHKSLEMAMFYGESDGSQIVRMPYGPPHSNPLMPFAMYVVLPRKGQSPEQLLSMISVEKLESQISSMRPRVGELSLPRFSLLAKNSFKEPLAQLGIRQAFSAPKANFSEITDSKPLWLGDLNQNISLLVNEQGTEAAVLTDAVYFLGPNPSKRFEMNVNRPFVFFVRDDRSGTIVLLGVVHKPLMERAVTEAAETELLRNLDEDESKWAVFTGDEKKEAHWKLERELRGARDYFVSKSDFRQAIQISNRLMHIEKPHCSALYQHAFIQLALGNTAAAESTFKDILKLYAEAKGSFEKTRPEWLEAFDKYDAMLSSKNPKDPERAPVLAAKESFLIQDVKDDVFVKEGVVGAWRRDLSTIGVPDEVSKITFDQFIERFDKDTALLSKDIVSLRLALKEDKSALQWKPSMCQGDRISRLGQSQSALAHFYSEHGSAHTAIQLFELCVINNIEDDYVEGVERDLSDLIEILNANGFKSEAKMVSQRQSQLMPIVHEYLELHLKWEELKKEEQRRWHETPHTSN